MQRALDAMSGAAAVAVMDQVDGGSGTVIFADATHSVGVLQGIIGKFYNPLDLWQQYCDTKVTGGAVQSGHYLPEENPTKVLAALVGFLR